MKIRALKQILLRKSTHDKTLSSFISSLDNKRLYGYVVESLQKMAKQKGTKKPNTAILDFAKSIKHTPELAKMMHDALSHHATRYSSALKSGNKKLAGQHMRQIFKMLHMTDKMINDGNINHTGGTLQADWVDPKPWERTVFPNKSGISGVEDPYRQEYYSTATKGLAREHSTYDYLSQAPHHSYAEEVHGHGHSGAWPLEETHVNGQHIDIDHNHKSKGVFEPHPFDAAPILQYYNMPNKDMTGSNHDNYKKLHKEFEANNFLNWLDSYTDSGAGKGKSSPAHARVNPLDTVAHLARMGITAQPRAASPQQTSAPAQKQSANDVKFNMEIPPIIGEDGGSIYDYDWDRVDKPPVIASTQSATPSKPAGSSGSPSNREEALRHIAEIKARYGIKD